MEVLIPFDLQLNSLSLRHVSPLHHNPGQLLTEYTSANLLSRGIPVTFEAQLVG